MHPRAPSFCLPTLLAATLFAAGCSDALGPVALEPDAPAAVEVAVEPSSISGTGTLGEGTATPGSLLQDFDFDVSSDLTGRLFFRDWSAVRESGTAGSITADETADPATGITAYRNGSAACADPTRGAEFDGIGRLDTGELYGFTVRACDNGGAESGTDYFEIVLPDRPYERGGFLSSGDIVDSGDAPPPSGLLNVTGTGALGNGTATPGSSLQDFDFDVASDLTGQFLYRDWAIVRGDGTVATVTVDPTDGSTGITSVRDGSAVCADPALGAEFDGTARLDIGDLVGFTIRVCDAGPADSGADYFEISVPSHSYTRSGTLSSGDVVKTIAAAEPTTGDLIVTAATSGAELDPDGYIVTVDDAASQTVGATGSITFSALAAGDHSVALSGVAENCAVAGSNPRTVSVPAGGTVTAAFEVACEAVGPTTGDLVVTTTTSGSNLDSDGYTVTVDGADRAIGTNGSITFAGLPAGDHTVALTDVASSCDVAGGNPRTVTVPAGGAASIVFSVTCESVPTRLVFTVQPSDTRVDARIEPAVQVTAVDAYGNRVSSYTGTVRISIGQNGGSWWYGPTLSGTRSVEAVNGVATFSDLRIDEEDDNYTLVARAWGLDGAESAEFDIVDFDFSWWWWWWF